jgi:hypothetical protein
MRILKLMALVFIGIVGWRIVDGMSSDAISMGIGVLFGVLAGIPMALLVLAADRRREGQREPRQADYAARYGFAPYGQQPPVIVVTGAGQGQPQQAWGAPRYALEAGPGWDAPRPDRRYRIVGEQDEWVSE